MKSMKRKRAESVKARSFSFCKFIHGLTLAAMMLAFAGPATAANLNRAYVTNFNDNTVSVIDTTNNTVVATITVGLNPFDGAVTPDGKHVYVANNGGNSVSVIDTSANAVTTTIPVGNGPAGVVVAADGHHVYAANSGDNTVSVIDTATNTISTITGFSAPINAAVTPDSAHLYVVNFGADSVSVIDAATNTLLTTVPVGNFPQDIAITPNGKDAYVTNNDDHTVSVIDTATNMVTATIPVGNGPIGLASTPNSKHVYVTNSGDDTVSVIDTANNTVIATVVVGNAPGDVAVTADGKQAYVANDFSNTVSVIDTATNTVTATVPVGSLPSGVATQPRHAKKNHEHEDGQADEGDNARVSPTRGMSGSALSTPRLFSLQNAPDGGRVMNATAPPAQNLAVNLLNAPSWYTDEPYTGTFEPEAVFQFQMPCTLGLGVMVTYTVAATDLNGGSVHTLGQTTQLLSVCVGQQTVTIPVATPFDLNNQLLKFTISSVGSVNLNMELGQNTFLLSTDYVGEP